MNNLEYHDWLVERGVARYKEFLLEGKGKEELKEFLRPRFGHLKPCYGMWPIYYKVLAKHEEDSKNKALETNKNLLAHTFSKRIMKIITRSNTLLR